MTPNRRWAVAAAAAATAAAATTRASMLGGPREANRPGDSPLGPALQGLRARDARARLEATHALRLEREALSRFFSEALRDIREARSPDRAFEGPTHRVLAAVEDWRIADGSADLAQLVTFELDRSTFPAGAKYHPSAYYPAARALAAIGDGEAIRHVLRNLRQAVEDTSQRINTWVLFSIHGEGLSRAILERAAVEAPAGPERSRLKEAADRVGLGDALLVGVNAAPEG